MEGSLIISTLLTSTQLAVCEEQQKKKGNTWTVLLLAVL